MFNNSSFNMIAVLVLLAAITLIFGTAVGMAPAAPSGISVSDWFERHPDAINLTPALGLSDYYQRHPSSLTVDTAGASDWLERHQVSAPSISARPKDYAALKDAQLEQKDAVQFGNANKVAGEEDPYLATQKEQRAAMKSLRSTDGAAPVPVTRVSYDELKQSQLARKDVELYGGFDVVVPVQTRPKSYADLKDAQLELLDAIQFGSAIGPAPKADLPRIE